MKRPNPLPPDQMTPAERRAELCGLLALGLVRLRMREAGEVSDNNGESCLHSPPDACRHATPTQPENRMTTHDPIPARLAALKTTTTPELKRSGATCSTANRRRSTGAISKAGWPTASRNWPMAG